MEEARELRWTKRPRWYVKEWREKRQMSQEELGEILGTNKGQVHKLETGEQRMNDDWIGAIAEALSITPRELLRDPEEPSVDDVLKGLSTEAKKEAAEHAEIIARRERGHAA